MNQNQYILRDSLWCDSTGSTLYTVVYSNTGFDPYIIALVNTKSITFSVLKDIETKINDKIYPSSVELSRFTIRSGSTLGRSDEFIRRVKNLDIDLYIGVLIHPSDDSTYFIRGLYENLFLEIDSNFSLEEIPENQWIRDFVPEEWDRALNKALGLKFKTIRDMIET